jgi:hypothetical protein
VLKNLTRRQWAEILKNEFTNDITYQKDMDTAYHNLMRRSVYHQIIGIGHKARQGKDTLAGMIKEMTTDECHIIHWADALYVEVSNKNSSVPLVFRKGSRFYFVDGSHALTAEYPGLEKIFNERGIESYQGMAEKDSPMLQFWGTNFRRKQDPNYWVNKVLQRIETLNGLIIIPDTRFQNEHTAIRANKGLYIEVQRFNGDGSRFISRDRDPNHPSEIDLDDIEANFTIGANSKCLHHIREQAIWMMMECGIDIKEEWRNFVH